MSTITNEQKAAIAAKLDSVQLGTGPGDGSTPCSIAAINMALRGLLTDQIPECMSEVVGRWMVFVQDAMPAEVRNSARWKALLPLAAGTGRKHEKERLALVIDWMWSAVLPAFQPAADECGFGAQWQRMLAERTRLAAAEFAHAACVARAARAGSPAAQAVWTNERAASWTVWAMAAAERAAKARTTEARAKAAAAAAKTTIEAAGGQTAWAQFDPCGLLERLVAVSAS